MLSSFFGDIMSTNPFLKQNKKEEEPIKVIVSDNFKDEKGNPVPFILKIISAEEADLISDSCIEPVFNPATKKKTGTEINQKKLQLELLVHSIVSPDLNDEELQKSWGAHDAGSLLNKMLNLQEKSVLIQEFDKHFQSSEEESEEAEIETKNV